MIKIANLYELIKYHPYNSSSFADIFGGLRMHKPRIGLKTAGQKGGAA